MKVDRCGHGVCEEECGVNNKVNCEVDGEEGYEEPLALAGLEVHGVSRGI